MSWEGYNFEDAIIIGERLVKNDIYTSIHIEEFDIEIRETKLGKEEFTPRHLERPPRSAGEPRRARRSSKSARYVRPATFWSARCRRSRKRTDAGRKVASRRSSAAAGEDVKNDSLEVPSGIGRHRHRRRHRFSRRMTHDRGREEATRQGKEGNRDVKYNKRIADAVPRVRRRARRGPGQEGTEGPEHR